MTVERTIKIAEREYDALLAAFTLYPWQDVAAHDRIMSKWNEASR